jgi:hypothetical protein
MFNRNNPIGNLETTFDMYVRLENKMCFISKVRRESRVLLISMRCAL